MDTFKTIAVVLMVFAHILLTTAMKQKIVLYSDEGCKGGDNDTFTFEAEETDVVGKPAEEAKALKFYGVWEIHIWDMQDTIHKIVKDTHPGVDPQCVTKRNLSSSFDLTFFKFRRLVRIGPAETSTPFLVLANDVELYGVRYSFFATRALDEPVCVKSLVVFGNINKFKAFADKHFAGPYNCFSFQGSGVSADDYSIQDVVPMTVHAVDPDLKGECTGKDIMIPAQEGTCEKGNPSSASGRNLQMKMYAFLLCLFMYQGSKY